MAIKKKINQGSLSQNKQFLISKNGQNKRKGAVSDQKNVINIFLNTDLIGKKD